MVVALGPGKFYGSSLPRPFFYSDVKLSPDGARVDPPPTVLDPLLSWARDAHWSMGGLSFVRHRLQGRIEGSISRLRAQQDRKSRLVSKAESKKSRSHTLQEEEEEAIVFQESSSSSDEEEEAPVVEEAPEETPRSVDRRRRSTRTRKLIMEDEELEEEAASAEAEQPKKKRARKLGDEFDKVAGVGGAISPLTPSNARADASPPSAAGAISSRARGSSSPPSSKVKSTDAAVPSKGKGAASRPSVPSREKETSSPPSGKVKSTGGPVPTKANGGAPRPSVPAREKGSSSPPSSKVKSTDGGVLSKAKGSSSRPSVGKVVSIVAASVRRSSTRVSPKSMA